MSDHPVPGPQAYMGRYSNAGLLLHEVLTIFSRDPLLADASPSDYTSDGSGEWM